MDALIIFCAQYLVVIVALGWAATWLRASKQDKKRLVVATVLAGVAALIAARLAGHIYFDPRPFVAEHIKPLIAHAPDNGFPSDHALLTMALTAVTYFFSKRMAAIMAALTVAVGVARVLAQIHSPLDIAGGWLIGILGAVAGFYMMRYLFARYAKPNTLAG